MRKIALIAIMFSFLLIGCSSNFVTSQQKTETKQKEEKLSKIDQIAKNMLEGDTDTTELVTNKNLPKEESDFLFNYGELINFLNRKIENNEIPDANGDMESFIDKKLRNEDIDSIIDMRVGNLIHNKIKVAYEYKYLDKLINKKIDPLLNLWNSGEVRIGMSEKDLLISCGSPNEINRTVTSNGSSEQWVYSNIYVYVENGKVTSFQD